MSAPDKFLAMIIRFKSLVRANPMFAKLASFAIFYLIWIFNALQFAYLICEIQA